MRDRNHVSDQINGDARAEGSVVRSVPRALCQSADMSRHRRTQFAAISSVTLLAVLFPVSKSAQTQGLVNPVTPPTRREAPRDGRDAFDLERLKQSLDRFEGQVPAQGLARRDPAAVPLGGRRGTPLAMTLQQAIDRALQENLGLRSTTLGTEFAGLEIPKAKAQFDPTVGLVLTYSGVRPAPTAAAQTTLTSRELRPLVAQRLPTGGSLVLSGGFTRFDQPNSAVTLSLVQPLLRGGRTYVATQLIRNAESDAKIAEENLKAQILSVTAGTKIAYYNVLLAEKVIGVTEAATARDRELIEASTALFEARLVTKRDVFSAELSLAQDSARLVSARADLETAKNALLAVLGLPIATDIALADKEIRFEPVELELEKLIATANRRRPEILAAQESLAKAELAVRVAQNGVLPQLDLVASYGRALTATSTAGGFSVPGDVWTAGVVASYPIGNAAARATLSQAEIGHKRRVIDMEQTRQNVEVGVRAAVIKLRKSVERIRSLIVAIEQARGKLEVGKAQFALGQATNLDVTDAQQSILNAETDLLTAIIDYNIGLAELEANIGGPLGVD